METSIGTYMERTLHAELKRLLEPDETRHEVRYKGYIADILNEDGIIEVQTRSFERLRGKLSCFLADVRVTLVFPAVRQKWLVWVDPETGETTKKRRSPKAGTVCSALPRSTRYGRRKSDHAALMAKIAITEQIGLDSGRTM